MEINLKLRNLSCVLKIRVGQSLFICVHTKCRTAKAVIPVFNKNQLSIITFIWSPVLKVSVS